LIKKGIGKILAMGFTQKGSLYYGISHNNMNVYIATLDPETGKILGPPKMAGKRFEGFNRDPNYSSDGKYLAYISNRGTLGLNSNRPHVLCIRSLETGQERELLPALNQIIDPLWSPDCRSLLVRGRDNKNCIGIYQIDAQTGDVTTIVLSDEYEEILFHSLEWSRDGKAIFYTIWDKKHNLCQIIFRDFKTGTEKILYNAPEKENLDFISLSPDGNWLALTNRRGERVLKIMPVVGGESRELYRFVDYRGEFSIPITWTVDGKYIIFSMQQSGKKYASKWDFFRIPFEGGEPEKLGLEMSGLYNPSIHPDGHHIAFGSNGSNPKWREVWVMENFLPE
jgi:Tol biopolymer transport system component